MTAGTGSAKPRAAALLFDWIAARLGDDGTVVMHIRAMADGAGLGVSTVEALMSRWKAAAIVRVLRRGGSAGPTRWAFDLSRRAEASACGAVHAGRVARRRAMGIGSRRGVVRDGAGVAEKRLARLGPVADRCPFCELPPGHADCRHGWNGLTTRAQRRAIAAAAGDFSPLAAA